MLCVFTSDDIEFYKLAHIHQPDGMHFYISHSGAVIE